MPPRQPISFDGHPGWKRGELLPGDGGEGEVGAVDPERLREGANEVIVFDLEAQGRQPLEGLGEAGLDEVLES